MTCIQYPYKDGRREPTHRVVGLKATFMPGHILSPINLRNRYSISVLGVFLTIVIVTELVLFFFKVIFSFLRVWEGCVHV